jgi:hypothetical protein
MLLVTLTVLCAEAVRVIFKQEPQLLILASRSHKTIEQTVAAIRKQTPPLL